MWDAANGVWLGDRAATNDFVPPDPLWIFGYGSLCWKAEFAHEEAVVGSVRGWVRRFAQRSTDHRGTPNRPGLVATLLTDEQMCSLGFRAADEAPSVTWGVGYRVGSGDVAQVLDNLDFREKGGYTRELISFHPRDGGTPVRALLYSATPDNPGFTAEAMRDPTAAARTIGTAHGPSGPNRDYLLNLAHWLASIGETDAHVDTLVSQMPEKRTEEPASLQ